MAPISGICEAEEGELKVLGQKGDEGENHFQNCKRWIQDLFDRIDMIIILQNWCTR